MKTDEQEKERICVGVLELNGQPWRCVLDKWHTGQHKSLVGRVFVNWRVGCEGCGTMQENVYCVTCD